MQLLEGNENVQEAGVDGSVSSDNPHNLSSDGSLGSSGEESQSALDQPVPEQPQVELKPLSEPRDFEQAVYEQPTYDQAIYGPHTYHKPHLNGPRFQRQVPGFEWSNPFSQMKFFADNSVQDG